MVSDVKELNGRSGDVRFVWPEGHARHVSDTFDLYAFAGQSHAMALAAASAQPVTPEHVAGVTERPTIVQVVGQLTHCAWPFWPMTPYVVGGHAMHVLPFQPCPNRQHAAEPVSASVPLPLCGLLSQLVEA